jgi:AcrR family transcriptional regulator
MATDESIEQGPIPAVGPDDTRADARRWRVYDAAIPLFDRFGFKKTTVGDVCEAAGISKRTFYDLFRDKLDLLRQLVRDVYDERTREWEEALDSALEPLDQLYAFLDLYASVPRDHPFLGVLFEDFDLMRAFGQWVDDLRISSQDGPLYRILREGMAAGQFRSMEPRAAMWVVFGLLDTVYFLIPRVMEVPGAMEDRALAEEVNRFIVHGLGAAERPERA